MKEHKNQRVSLTLTLHVRNQIKMSIAQAVRKLSCYIVELWKIASFVSPQTVDAKEASQQNPKILH